MPKTLRNGYCIFIDTICQGAVPVVSDGEDNCLVFETELDAQKEIADNMITRLRQFIEGERDFDDAVTLEEYVVQVTVHPNGAITDREGNSFGPHYD